MTPGTLYPWELHAHTSPVSSCGRLSAREVVEMVAHRGYHGLVITDHYYPERFKDGMHGKAFEKEIRYLFSGFREAEAAGRDAGITVLCGSELRIAAGMEDYLLYGMTEDIALEVGQLCDLSLADVRGKLLPYGVLIVQAHPFRPGLRAADPSLLDGMEVFNGNPRHDSRNDQALLYARAHGLLMTYGSDIHQIGDEARAKMMLPHAKDNRQFVEHLRIYAQEKYAAE